MFSIVAGFEFSPAPADWEDFEKLCASIGVPGGEWVSRRSDRKVGQWVEVCRKVKARKVKAGKVKASKRFNGGEDLMILPVGKPGSKERVEALREWYTPERIGMEDSAFRDE